VDQNHERWLATQHKGSQVAFTDLKHEVERADERLKRLDEAVAEAAADLPEKLRAVVEALQGLKGVGLVTAATIVAEVGDLTRFARAPQLMSYGGVVPTEHSSGSTIRRGRITKAGNSHLRRVLGEAAWQYKSSPRVGAPLKRRQAGLSQEVTAISWRAQHRLHQRYKRLVGRGKDKRKVATALGRELLGFIWAIGQQIEREQRHRAAA
jgi:transposase